MSTSSYRTHGGYESADRPLSPTMQAPVGPAGGSAPQPRTLEKGSDMDVYPRIVEATVKVTGKRKRLVQLCRDNGGNLPFRDEHSANYHGDELTDITPVEELWDDLPEVARDEDGNLRIAGLLPVSSTAANKAHSDARAALRVAREYEAIARFLDNEATQQAETHRRQDLLDHANDTLLNLAASNSLPGACLEIDQAIRAGARLAWPKDDA